MNDNRNKSNSEKKAIVLHMIKKILTWTTTQTKTRTIKTVIVTNMRIIIMRTPTVNFMKMRKQTKTVTMTNIRIKMVTGGGAEANISPGELKTFTKVQNKMSCRYCNPLITR